MRLRIYSNNKLLSILLLLLCSISLSASGAEYVSTDDLLGVDAESTRGFLDVEDQEELGNTVPGSKKLLEEEQDDFLIDDSSAPAAGVYTVALSRNVRELCVLPEDLTGKIFNALEKNILSSGKFDLLNLDRDLQGELAAEVRRVVAQGVSDSNAVNLGSVSGVKYIAVLTIEDFSVRQRSFPGSQRFRYGALEFDCRMSLRFIDTSTHKIAAQAEASAKQLAALPRQYNYVDKGTDIKSTAKAKQLAAEGRWSWVGDSDFYGTRAGRGEYAREDAVRNLRTINGWNVRQQQNRDAGANDYSEEQSLMLDESAAVDMRQVEDRVKVTSRGAIEEDAMYKEYYRLSQESFASAALGKLADKLAVRISESLAAELYPVKVIKRYKKNRVAINAGKANGLRKGQILQARSRTSERDPDTGRLLFFEVPLGRVKIISVNKNSAMGSIISLDEGEIKKGSILYQLSAKELEEEGDERAIEPQQDFPFKQHKKKSNDW